MRLTSDLAFLHFLAVIFLSRGGSLRAGGPVASSSTDTRWYVETTAPCSRLPELERQQDEITRTTVSPQGLEQLPIEVCHLHSLELSI